MEHSTVVLSVIICFCSLFLTIPPGCTHLGNAATVGPGVECFGNYAFTRKSNRNANGAQLYASENTANECQIRCANIAACTSLDFNTVNNECWIHTSNVENSLRTANGINHYERVSCPSSTVISSTGTTGLPPTIPFCVKNKAHFDEYEDTYVLGGTEQATTYNTILKCLERCADVNSCTAADFNTQSERCFFHTADPEDLTRQTDTSDPTILFHFVKESCTTPGTTGATTPTATGTTLPDVNAPVQFTAYFTNDFDATINDIDAFIATFRAEFCDDTGVRCSRLIKPRDPEDVSPVTVKYNPGPNIGYINVTGELAPGVTGETDTQDVMERFEETLFQNFRHRLSAENGQIKLKPDTATAYEGFSWKRIPTAPPPEEEEEDGPLGLKVEYWILIGLAILALIITVVAVAIICLLRRNKSESSGSDQKRKEKKRAEQERKRREKEERKREAQEKRAQEKERKLKEKKDKDVEKGEDNTYTEPDPEPDVVPSNVDDTPSGLSDEDKTY